MKTFAFLTLMTTHLGHAVFGQEFQQARPVVQTAGVGSAVAYQTGLARANVALAKSLLNENILKGAVGEAIRDQTVGRYLHSSGQWLNVSPRLGPQGLDHVSVQLNESGKPHRLMVDETKFGSSGLSRTVSGDLQMGDKYISKRLLGLSKAYDKIHIQAQSAIQSVIIPTRTGAKTVIPVPLNDSLQVSFWRAHGTGPWLFDGPPELLPKATAQLKSISDLLRDGADGRIDFRKRIVQVKPIEGMRFEVTIRNAADVEKVGGRIEHLPVSLRIVRSLNEPEWNEVVRRGIARELLRANPALPVSKSDFLAQRLIAEAKSTEDLLSKVSFEKALSDVRFSRFTIFDASKSGAAAILIAVPLELVFQAFSNNPLDWSHLGGIGALAGGSGAAGNAVGNATTALVRRELGHSASTAAAEILGLRSASRFANVAGGAVGGGAAGVLFAYGGYWLGYYDLQTANRTAIVGVAGAGAGAAASAATFALIGTYATASTGTAISTLGGGAVFNSSMAWLGGGSLATGGSGMAGGWVVLTGGGAIVIIGVTAAVLYGFHLADTHQDSIRLAKTIEYLSEKKTFFNSDAQPTFSR